MTDTDPSDFDLGPPLTGVGPLAVRVIGSAGPVVVLIHGLGRAAAGWGRVARAVRGIRLVLPDNPGLGRSGALPVPDTIEEHAALYAQTLTNLGLEPPFHVAGLSLGGMVAPALASLLGPRCESLTMFSASSRETGFWRLDPFALFRIAGRCVLHLGFDHRANLPELVRPAVLAAEPKLAKVLDRMRVCEGFSMKAGFQQLVAAMRFRIGPHLSKLPKRRLVVVGADDLLVPPSNSRRLARLVGAPLLEIAEGAHDLAIDAPREVAGVVMAMVRGEDPAAIRLVARSGEAGNEARPQEGASIKGEDLRAAAPESAEGGT